MKHRCLAQGSRRYSTSGLSLTTCLCSAREHVAKSGDKAENNQDITAQVQGNHPNFKQKLAEKKCRLKSQRKPDAVWQIPSQSSKVPKVDKGVEKNKYESENKNSSQKAVFSR